MCLVLAGVMWSGSPYQKCVKTFKPAWTGSTRDMCCCGRSEAWEFLDGAGFLRLHLDSWGGHWPDCRCGPGWLTNPPTVTAPPDRAGLFWNTWEVTITECSSSKEPGWRVSSCYQVRGTAQGLVSHSCSSTHQPAWALNLADFPGFSPVATH